MSGVNQGQKVNKINRIGEYPDFGHLDRTSYIAEHFSSVLYTKYDTLKKNCRGYLILRITFMVGGLWLSKIQG